MLTALETGVEGGRWYSLMDKVSRPATLRSAFAQVKANRGAAGADRETIEMFEKRLEQHLEELTHQLRAGTYRPYGVRRQWIPKPGSSEKRPLGIPTVRDRVVQGALRMVMEPIFEREFAAHSYGFRPGRGCHDALRRVDELLSEGHVYVVDADLKSFFDTIPHAPLMARVQEKISDGKVLELVNRYLSQRVMEGVREWTSEEGTPQGAVMSPLLANVYLNPLDHVVARAGMQMVRYADDFVILCRSEEDARSALELVQGWTAQAGLTLHPSKTRIVHSDQGFDFLGYHFERGYKWPRDKSLKKFKDAIRAKTRRRTSGKSLREIIKNVNQSARGWFNYFQFSVTHVFVRLDQWIRMRLRSILRNRDHRRGRGRGQDHQRWPNAYFNAHGLFSLSSARRALGQSSPGR
jgi:RNA-directed DNA polymerase